MSGVFGEHYTGVKFVPTARLDDINTQPSGGIYRMAKSGDYIFAAAFADGIYVFDVSDPTAPVQEDDIPFRRPNGDTTTMNVCDVLIIGTTLFACGRKIDFSESNETGIIAAYNITDPTSVTWIDSYQHPELGEKYRSPDRGDPPYTGQEVSNHWFQGMAYDGTYIHLASQRGGATVLNPAPVIAGGSWGVAHDAYDYYDLAQHLAIYTGTHTGSNGSATLIDSNANSGSGWTVNELNPGGAGQGYQVLNLTSGIHMRAVTNTSTEVTGYLASTGTLNWDTGDSYVIINPTEGWESSSVTFNAGWAHYGTHGDSLVSMQVTAGILSNPNVVTPLRVTRLPPNTGLLQLRVRDVVDDGTYLFACTNVSKEGVDVTGRSNKDAKERGLTMLDITSPATNDSDDWYTTPIGDDAQFWDGAADQPHLGLFQYGDYAYVGNGRGIAVFDVSTRTAPVYIGNHGEVEDPENSNIYAPYVWEDGGKTYICYGHALEVVDKHNFYISEVKFYP